MGRSWEEGEGEGRGGRDENGEEGRRGKSREECGVESGRRQGMKEEEDHISNIPTSYSMCPT